MSTQTATAPAILPFDDRDGVIWYNGKFTPWRNATTHILCHGLHYASSVFEGIRAYEGKVFKLTEHNQRLHDSAALLEFKIPYSVEELNNATLEVLKQQNLKDAYIRPVAWKGSEKMAVSSQNNKVHVAIAAWQWPPYYKLGDNEGIRATLAKWARPAPNTAPTASKAAGLYMIATLAKQDAEAKGYQEAFMLDWRGYVAEATSANMFLVMNGEVHTPKPDCFLDGITRRTVIDLAKQHGYKVVERHIKPEEFANTQEVFLTGTAAEVTPVSEFDNYKFTVGPVTKTLRDAYSKLVRS